jgi:hypothetical protein
MSSNPPDLQLHQILGLPFGSAGRDLTQKIFPAVAQVARDLRPGLALATFGFYNSGVVIVLIASGNNGLANQNYKGRKP